ncbi:hypothetical protein KR084_000402, partial [Drosophila pseudotakahashii]
EVPSESIVAKLAAMKATAKAAAKAAANAVANAAGNATGNAVESAAGNAAVKPAANAAATAADNAGGTFVAPLPVLSIMERVMKGSGAIAGVLADIRIAHSKALVSSATTSRMAGEIQETINRYEEVIAAMMVQMGVLEDRARRQPALPPVASVASYAATAARGAHLVAQPAAPVAAPRSAIRETWSAVVACDDPALSGRQIADKIRKEVAPALGVRVHEVRELKRGGAIIRTPSQAEMTKVVASAKFAEVGLKVSQNTAAKPRVIVQDVDTTIGHEEF